MVRLSDLSDYEAGHLLDLPCPVNADSPWTAPPPLTETRIALVTTSGLSRRGDDTFRPGAADYRVIPDEIASSDLIMSHVSVNYDRSGFQQDINVVFPIDRLHELVADGVVGSAASLHYSFMGATEPEKMEAKARALAGMLKEDGVNAVLLTPV
jgi:D-proline reductase (dithiol) PrdB